jgi:hypothetical protein
MMHSGPLEYLSRGTGTGFGNIPQAKEFFKRKCKPCSPEALPCKRCSTLPRRKLSEVGLHPRERPARQG